MSKAAFFLNIVLFSLIYMFAKELAGGVNLQWAFIYFPSAVLASLTVQYIDRK